jgi:hypothetical protein
MARSSSIGGFSEETQVEFRVIASRGRARKHWANHDEALKTMMTAHFYVNSLPDEIKEDLKKIVLMDWSDTDQIQKAVIEMYEKHNSK